MLQMREVEEDEREAADQILWLTYPFHSPLK